MSSALRAASLRSSRWRPEHVARHGRRATFGEGQLGAVRRRRRARCDRLGDQAICLIETLGERVAKARDQRQARQGIETLDPLEPQALQHLDGIGVQAERRHGQRRQRHPGAARRAALTAASSWARSATGASPTISAGLAGLCTG